MEGFVSCKGELVWAVLDEQLLTFYDDIDLQNSRVEGYRRSLVLRNAKIKKKISEDSKFSILIETISFWKRNCVEIDFRDDDSSNRWYTSLVRATDLHNEDVGRCAVFEKHCATLGISPHSSAVSKRTVTTAFRKICIAAHPDKGGSAEEFSRISDAYNYLLAYASEQEPATTLTYEAVVEKCGGGVGLGIGVVEGRFKRGLVVSRVDDYIKLRGLSEAADGAIRPGDSLIAIDRDDCSRWLLPRVRARLNNIRVPMGSTVVFTFERRIPVENDEGPTGSESDSGSFKKNLDVGSNRAADGTNGRGRWGIGRERAQTEPALLHPNANSYGHTNIQKQNTSADSRSKSRHLLSNLFTIPRPFSSRRRHMSDKGSRPTNISSSSASPTRNRYSNVSFADNENNENEPTESPGVQGVPAASAKSPSTNSNMSMGVMFGLSPSKFASLQKVVEVYREKEVCWAHEKSGLLDELALRLKENKELSDKLSHSLKEREALAATNELLLLEVGKLRYEKNVNLNGIGPGCVKPPSRGLQEIENAWNDTNTGTINTHSQQQTADDKMDQTATATTPNAYSGNFQGQFDNNFLAIQGSALSRQEDVGVLEGSNIAASIDEYRLREPASTVNGVYAAVEERSSRLEERLAFLLKTATELVAEGEDA